MNRIQSLQEQTLEWAQQNVLKMNYELKAGDDVVATLRFRSAFGSHATGENADGCWTFKRVGLFQTRATIRACGSDAEIATFTNNTWSGGGALECNDGHKFLVTTNLWQTHLEVKDASGRSLLRLKNEGILRASATLKIQPSGLTMPEMSWMMIFIWYLAVMMRIDSSVGVGGGGAH
jgi:hypothetical protein